MKIKELYDKKTFTVNRKENTGDVHKCSVYTKRHDKKGIFVLRQKVLDGFLDGTKKDDLDVHRDYFNHLKDTEDNTDNGDLKLVPVNGVKKFYTEKLQPKIKYYKLKKYLRRTKDRRYQHTFKNDPKVPYFYFKDSAEKNAVVNTLDADAKNLGEIDEDDNIINATPAQFHQLICHEFNEATKHKIVANVYGNFDMDNNTFDAMIKDDFSYCDNLYNPAKPTVFEQDPINEMVKSGMDKLDELFFGTNETNIKVDTDKHPTEYTPLNKIYHFFEEWIPDSLKGEIGTDDLFKTFLKDYLKPNSEVRNLITSKILEIRPKDKQDAEQAYEEEINDIMSNLDKVMKLYDELDEDKLLKLVTILFKIEHPEWFVYGV